jgi:hypothetical protein
VLLTLRSYHSYPGSAVLGRFRNSFGDSKSHSTKFLAFFGLPGTISTDYTYGDTTKRRPSLGKFGGLFFVAGFEGEFYIFVASRQGLAETVDSNLFAGCRIEREINTTCKVA